MTSLMRGLAAALALGWGIAALAQADETGPMTLHIDADFGISRDSAEAIELGIRAALRLAGDRMAGEKVEVVRRNHAGNVRRAHATMTSAAADPRALAMSGGLHSPPHLARRPEISARGLPTLLPWSAAGPITRLAGDGPNYLFRLSVDDTKAGRFLVAGALEKGCTAMALLLLDTGWGHANHDPIVAALAERGSTPAHTQFFPVGMSEAMANALVRDIAATGADCVLMLANGREGAFFVNALAETGEDTHLLSH